MITPFLKSPPFTEKKLMNIWFQRCGYNLEYKVDDFCCIMCYDENKFELCVSEPWMDIIMRVLDIDNMRQLKTFISIVK